MPIENIYVDMDGVCCDFVNPMVKLLKSRGQKLEAPAPGKPIDYSHRYGVFPSEIDFKTIPSSFWENLPILDGTLEVFWMAQSLVGVDNVYIATSPPDENYGSCCDGKRAWVRKNLPLLDIRKVIFVNDKFGLANPAHILIDDTQKVIDKFNAYKGKGIIRPQLWNSQWKLAESNPAEYVISKMKEIHGLQ